MVLLNREFGDKEYERDRFDFSMETIKSIYSEPNPTPKRRKFNFGINKTVQVGLEEEDLRDIKSAVVSTVRDRVTSGVEEGLHEIEQAIVDELVPEIASSEPDKPSKKKVTK